MAQRAHRFCQGCVVSLVLMIVALALYAQPVSGAVMAQPGGQNVLPAYPLLGPAAQSSYATEAMPIGVGSCSSAVQTLNLQVSLSEFSGPVDVYLGIYVPVIDQNNIYLLTSDNAIQPLSKGLVPWKSKVAQPVEEVMFNTLPVSALPAGAYSFYVAVTPAESRESFYLWSAQLAVPGPCAPGEVKEGSAGFAHGKIIAPGASIVHQGVEHRGEIALSGNGLVGIVREGRAYLYHPALGNAELSEETTRRALGSFIAGLSVGDAQAGGTAAAPAWAKVTPETQPYTSKVGVIVEFPDVTKPAILKNDKRRWAGVMPERHFLAPRNPTLPGNLVEAAYRGLNKELITWGYTPLEVSMGKKEIYGSIARLFPLWFSDTYKTEREALIRGADEAWKHDPVFFAHLNAIEFLDVNLSALQTLLGVIPSECVESFASTAVSQIKTMLMTLVTLGQGGADLYQAPFFLTSKETLMEGTQTLIECVMEGASLGWLNIVFKAADVLSGVNWIVEEMIVPYFQMRDTLTSYEEVSLIAPRCGIGFDPFITMRTIDNSGNIVSQREVWRGQSFYAHGVIWDNKDFKGTIAMPWTDTKCTGTLDLSLNAEIDGSLGYEEKRTLRYFDANMDCRGPADRQWNASIVGVGLEVKADLLNYGFFGRASGRQACNYVSKYEDHILDTQSANYKEGFVRFDCDDRSELAVFCDHLW